MYLRQDDKKSNIWGTHLRYRRSEIESLKTNKFIGEPATQNKSVCLFCFIIYKVIFIELKYFGSLETIRRVIGALRPL